MSQRDYYEVLEVGREADASSIKKAYRRLAMKYHPDRNDSPDAEAKFKEASEAYEVLSDNQKRDLYDRHGFAGLKQTGFSGFSGMGVDDIFSSFGDIFGDLFGMGARTGRRGGARRGADLRSDITIEFDEAVFGCSKEVSVRQEVACETCDGVGAAPGTTPVACGTCAGRGQVMHGQGLFLISTTCPDCQGQGSRYTSSCDDCGGKGKVPFKRTLNVKIPAGFDDGMSLRYAGQGDAGGMGGPAGDLYIAVSVNPHEHLIRKGDDLVFEATLGMVAAALGTTIEVPTPDGEESVTVPAGTQPGEVITLRKKGVPRLRGGGRGNLHIVVKVDVPTNLTSKQRKVLEEFDELPAGKKQKRRLFS
ncbi:MAG: molecular chaperone DnaJ [Myxococcota bacterium]|nr:molecular chaperone DnaJ [Myxococcota bacterium]